MFTGFPGGAVVKNLSASAGDARDAGSISGSGRSPGDRNGNLLQYSCLENSVDRGAWRATVPGVVELDMTELVSAFTHPHPHTHTPTPTHTHTHTVVVFLFSLFVDTFVKVKTFHFNFSVFVRMGVEF